MDLEEIRRSYRRDSVSVLFVGESPPSGGTFFFCENSRLFTHTVVAFRDAFGLRPSDPKRFLSLFKHAGCYLDDLSLTPLNHLDNSHRRKARRRAMTGFRQRVESVHPQAVVCVKELWHS